MSNNTMQPNSSFLDEGYETPKSPSQYFKLKAPGTYDVRILSKPIIGYVEFDAQNKPHRYRVNAQPKTPIDAAKPPRFFWTMVIFSYTDNNIMIWETTSKSIIETIEGLAKNPKWNSPIGYDLSVTRKGTTKNDTEYSVAPTPHSPIPIEAFNAFQAIPIRLEALWSNGNPFEESALPITPLLPGAQVAPQGATFTPSAQPQAVAAPAMQTTTVQHAQPLGFNQHPSIPQETGMPPSGSLDDVTPDDGTGEEIFK